MLFTDIQKLQKNKKIRQTNFVFFFSVVATTHIQTCFTFVGMYNISKHLTVFTSNS